MSLKLKSSKLRLLIWASLPFCGYSLAETTQTVQTSQVSKAIEFSQAWSILQDNNNSLAAERSNVERYQYLQEATDSLNYPKITLGASYTRLDDDIVLSGREVLKNTTIPSSLPPAYGTAIKDLAQALKLGDIQTKLENQDVFSSSIRAVWPIFTGWRISAAQSGAEGKKRAAVSQMQMETQARYEDLSRYFFSVLLTERVVQTRQAMVDGLRQHQQNALKLEQQGQIAHVEKLQADVSLKQAEVELKKAQKSLEIAQSALTQVLNMGQNVRPKGRLFVNAKLPPLATFLDQTLATYPGLSLLDAKEKQARSLIEAERGRYYPDVYMFGNYDLYQEDSLVGDLKPDWLVGVGVNVPLMDTSGRSEKVQAAKSALRQVRFLKEQARQDLRVLVEKTYQEAEQALDEVNGLETSLQLADENLRLRQKAFSQGLNTSVDVVDAQLFQASVRTQQALASFEYLMALNKLLALTNSMTDFKRYEQTAVVIKAVNEIQK
ncbi:MAG: TolC family protein [Hydrogenovibrio sp.]